jgi:sulfoxide reductase heme-binding subunit YedZ
VQPIERGYVKPARNLRIDHDFAATCSRRRGIAFFSTYTSLTSHPVDGSRTQAHATDAPRANTVRLTKWMHAQKREPGMARSLESWRLFWLLALIISVANSLWLPFADFHSASGTALMIQRSVRYALPLFLFAFTASSLATLWPGRLSRWLLRNRRYVGLGFAFGMLWHLSFIGYSILQFGTLAGGPTPKGLALDLVGLAFLILMTLTSFRRLARHMTSANWRRLHKTGIYVIWFVATYIYLRHAEDAFRNVAFALLIAAWMLRVIARANIKANAAARSVPS